jgi:hypothetical protein
LDGEHDARFADVMQLDHAQQLHRELRSLLAATNLKATVSVTKQQAIWAGKGMAEKVGCFGPDANGWPA